MKLTKYVGKTTVSSKKKEDWPLFLTQKGNTNVKVVAKLQTEVMNALNSTFTEADWPKGTKKGDESFSSKI